jgi:hypothetical protein
VVVGIPAPPKKTTPPVDVPKGSPPTKHLPPVKPKPVPESKPHPIIVVSKTMITTDPATKHLDIVVTLSNLSSVEANVHLYYDISWNENAMPDSIATRDVAFAPSPYSFDLNFSTTPTAAGQMMLENKTGKLSIVINASYPDQGGTTTYKYQGFVVPNATKLDDYTSWDTEPAKQ